jgi:hypothetical protein
MTYEEELLDFAAKSKERVDKLMVRFEKHSKDFDSKMREILAAL